MARGKGLIAAAMAAGLVFSGSASAAPDAGASISLSTAKASPGDTIKVTLAGFGDVTTIAICGNDAQRGAVDCDQISSVGVPASTAGPAQQVLRVTVPPSPCPCVVRASTAAETTVKTVAIDVVGAPTAPVQAAPPVGASTVAVQARTVSEKESLLNRLRSTFAGPTRRTLVLQLRNLGTAPLTGLSVSAAVGRDTQGGEPLQPPNVDLLQPGGTQTYRLLVSLGAPSYGSYEVFGTVYGAGPPVSFSTSTSTQPWGLLLIVVLFLVDVVAMAYVRLQRRRRERALLRSEEKATTKQTEAEQTRPSFQGSEPADMVGGDALQNT